MDGLDAREMIPATTAAKPAQRMSFEAVGFMLRSFLDLGLLVLGGFKP
jgi:hypothetical protein